MYNIESDESNTVLSMIVSTDKAIEYAVSIKDNEEDIAIWLSAN